MGDSGAQSIAFCTPALKKPGSFEDEGTMTLVTYRGSRTST